MTKHLQDWADAKPLTGSNGVVKQTIGGAGASLVRVVVPAGTRAERHHHGHEQFVHVVGGTGELKTEQGLKTFGPGSVFHFPAHAWHAAYFATETVLVETNQAF